MGLFGTKKVEDKPAVVAVNEGAQAPASQVRLVESQPHGSGRVGIDHAIQLIRSLPTEKDVDLVVTVLKTTLESLGIRVADIVEDASQRQLEIENRVGQFKTEIAALEMEIKQRADEIERLEAAHAETTKVRDYLQRDVIQHVREEEPEESLAREA